MLGNASAGGSITRSVGKAADGSEDNRLPGSVFFEKFLYFYAVEEPVADPNARLTPP